MNANMAYLRGGAIVPNRRYLRGTLATWAAGRSTYSKPTLENKLRSLQRQINKNKPALVEFSTDYTQIHSGSGYVQNTRDLTDDLVAATDFRDKINGQDFTNAYLRLNFVGGVGFQQVRVVIYHPLTTLDSFTPGATQAGMATVPPIKQFKVLLDTFLPIETSSSYPVAALRVPLRGLLTKLSDGGTAERGNLKMLVLSNSTGASNAAINVLHVVADK